MAFLARFFSPRRNQKKESNVHQTLQKKKSLRSTYTIESDQVRVLLFRECDWRGRKLLFDSSCIQKVSVSNVPLNKGGRPRRNSKDHVFEINNGFGYKYSKLSKDATSLGETIFGSVALSQRKSSIKVHSLSTPRRLMLSGVIHSPRPNDRKRQVSDRSLDDSYGSSINSTSDYLSGSSTDFKPCSGEVLDSSFDQNSFGNCDSVSYCPIHCSNLMPHNSTNSSSNNQSGGSLTSLRRRWLRSVTTSMNLDSQHNLIDIDTTQTAESNSSNESTHNYSQSSAGRRTKLGVAIVITLQESHEKGMEEYLLQRLPLLVHLVTRLQQSSERAYVHKDSFIQLMMEATCNTSRMLYDLLCGVSIEKPYWLALTNSQYPAERGEAQQTELVSRLIKDLGYLLHTVDTKHTKFFMSTLITAVLTHHLGWVPTIVPDDQEIGYEKEHKYDLLSALSQSHPYNPLWAQISDLQGALGFPSKIAKTVIIGQSEILVSKVLSVLTYFIRCGRVFYKPQERLEDPSEDCLLEAIVSSKCNSSEKSLCNKVEKYEDLMPEIKLCCNENVKINSSPVPALCKRKNFTNLNSFSKIKINSSNNFENRNCCYECNLHSSNNLKVCDVNRVGLKKTVELKYTNSSPKLNSEIDMCYSKDNLSENDLNTNIICDKVLKLCRIPKSAVLFHMNDNEDRSNKTSNIDKRDIINCKSNDLCKFIKFPKRIESEKQLASIDIKNLINQKLSFSKISLISDVERGEELELFESSRNSDFFLLDKKNLPSTVTDEKIEKSLCSSNVIFVVGENEKLVGLKNNSFQNSDKCNSNINFKLDKPEIKDCIKDCEGNTINKNQSVKFYIEAEEGKKTDVSDNIEENLPRNKILICKPTTVDVKEHDEKSLSSFCGPPQRCLSIPDEVLLTTDEMKESRSRDTIEIISRWFSDSEIYNNFDNNSVGKKYPLVNNITSSVNNEASNFSDCLYRISDNRIIERTSIKNPSSGFSSPQSDFCGDCVELNERTRESDVNINIEIDKSSRECCVDCDSRTVEKSFLNSQQRIPSSDIHLPLPTSKKEESETEINLAQTLIGGVSDHYIPSLVLQGIVDDGIVDITRPTWEFELRRDLKIEAHSPVLNQDISEAVCIVANIDTWEVQLVSSRTLVVKKMLEGRNMGVRVGMSQLVANMLETVLNLCKLSVHPKHCLSHIEAKLGEFWLRSISLAEILLSSEFLDMETLTTALDLDPNDVPLLLSVASIHSPQVTKKYGLSFE